MARIFALYHKGDTQCAVITSSVLATFREEGFLVEDADSALVGASMIAFSNTMLYRDIPLVILACQAAAGDSHISHLARSASSEGASRVFVIQIESNVQTDHLTPPDRRAAPFFKNGVAAVFETINAIRSLFPEPDQTEPPARTAAHGEASDEYLDMPALGIEIDGDAVRRYVDELKTDFASEWSKLQVLDPTAVAKFLAVDIDGSLTRLGALLFGVRSDRLMPHTVVQCVRYPAFSRAAGDIRNDLESSPSTRDSERFHGNLLQQIDGAIQFVRKHSKIGESVEGAGAVRELYDYPLEAVREVIVNALVHRDYSQTDMNVSIRLYADRFEAISPGAWHRPGSHLQDGPTFLSELIGQSKKRNPRLAHLMAAVRRFEGEGSGLPTIIYACAKHDCPPPVAVTQDGCVIVRISKKGATGTSASASVDLLYQKIRLRAAQIVAQGGSQRLSEGDRNRLVYELASDHLKANETMDLGESVAVVEKVLRTHGFDWAT